MCWGDNCLGAGLRGASCCEGELKRCDVGEGIWTLGCVILGALVILVFDEFFHDPGVGHPSESCFSRCTDFVCNKQHSANYTKISTTIKIHCGNSFPILSFSLTIP